MGEDSTDLETLRRTLEAMSRGPAAARRPPLAFGIAEIDGALPQGGLAPGRLHEVLAAPGDEGARIGLLAALLAGAAPREAPILWCRGPSARRSGCLYAPGLLRFGLDPARLILVAGRGPADALWAAEEGLRSRALAAVVAEGVMPDLVAGRRLQLAAEAGDTPAFVLPPPTESAPRASAATTRWQVAPAPSRERDLWVGPGDFDLELVRCRAGRPGRWRLGWDDETLRFDRAEALADRSPAPAYG